jgi:hypothetical protein
MRLLARAGPGRRCPGPGAPHPVVASHIGVDARVLVMCKPSGYWRLHGRAERRLFVEEDQDGDHCPTHHVLNRTGRVVTVTGGQSDDDDEVVDTGLGRAGRGEVEPVLTKACVSKPTRRSRGDVTQMWVGEECAD